MRFQPSTASFGAVDPDAISATAELLAAATGTGVTIGREVRAARARKARRRRRRRRRPAPAGAPVAPIYDTDDEPSQAPQWLLPAVLVGSLGLLGYAYMQSQKEG
jgi:hypothetical protein